MNAPPPSSRVTQSAWLRYGVAILVVLAGAAVRLAFLQALEMRVTYVTFYPAVILAALYGGLGPGLLATGLSALLADYFWIETVGHFLPMQFADSLGMAIFIVTCGGISWITDAMHRARSRAAHAQAQAKFTAELVQANEALRESEERLRLAQSGAHVGIWDWHLGSGKLEWTLELEQLYGFSPGTFPGNYAAFRDCVHPDDLAKVERQRDAAVAAHRDFDFDFRVRLPSGETRWVNSKGAAIYDTAGNPERMFGVNVDITARKQAEAALRESEARLRRAQEIAHLGSWELDLVRDRLSWSDEVYRIFGLAPREFGATYEAFLDCVHSEDRQRVDDAYAGSLRENRDTYEIEHRVVRKDNGAIRIVHEKCEHFRDAAGQIIRSVGMVHDITERKQAEAALRLSEERFRKVFESSSDCILVWDRQCNYLYANQAAIDHVGTTRDQVIGKNIRDGLGHIPDFMHLWMARVEQAFATGEPFRVEDSVPVGGRLVHSESQVSPIRDASGQVFAVSVVYRDVTERKQTEEALRRSNSFNQSIIDSSSDCIKILNMDGRLQYMSPGGQHLLGIKDIATYLNVPYEEFWKGSDREAVIEVVQKAKQGQSGSFQGFCPTANGTPKWWDVCISPVLGADGRPERLLAVSRDITERVQLESELQQRNKELAQEARRKDEFLAMLAHELRNPLAPIRNAVHLLRLIGPAEPRLEQARDMIDRQVAHMVRLIDDLLDVSRITRGKISLRKERLDLAEVVAQAAEVAGPLLTRKRQAFTLSCAPEPIEVEADPARLVQVIANLLNNAAKFTEPGGSITLSTERCNDDACGTAAVIRVRDTGVGIAPELLPYIFDLFVQGETSLDRTEGGLGIGLTLVRHLVEQHGGRIEARSAGRGCGSEFVVTWPAAPPALAATARAAAVESAEPGRRLRILVVEDNLDAAESFVTLLQLQGHEIRAAQSGLTALEVASSFVADVAFIDLGLPGMDGYEVARRLRAIPGFQATVLVALTGYGQDEDKRRSLDAGFDHHLTKPVDPATIDRLLIGIGGPSEARPRFLQ
jgi:PAS domain S-box-containing protein